MQVFPVTIEDINFKSLNRFYKKNRKLKTINSSSMPVFPIKIEEINLKSLNGFFFSNQHRKLKITAPYHCQNRGDEFETTKLI